MKPRIPIRRRARVRRVLAVFSELRAIDDEIARADGLDERAENETDWLVFQRLFGEEMPLINWRPGRLRAFLLAACCLCPEGTLDAWGDLAESYLAGVRNTRAELARDEAIGDAP